MPLNAPRSLLANKGFTLHAGSAFVSMLGDQLTLIALPWLMLTMTNEPGAVGALFALLGIPRAVVILFGGALADRFHPVAILSVTRGLSFVVQAILALLVWKGTLVAGHLYCFAAWLGLCSALAIPAGQAILPRLLEKKHFGSANNMMMGLTQLATLCGPVASGTLVYVFQKQGEGRLGYTLVFALDALSFACAFIALRFIALPRAAAAERGPGLRRSLSEGWSRVRGDAALSSFLVYIGLISLLTTGPVMVGVPLLVKSELQGNVFEYGTFLVFLNLGALLSMPFSSTSALIPPARFVPLVLGLDVLVGLLIIAFVNVEPGVAPRAILLTVGLLTAYVQVALITRIQKRVEQRMIGRVMSYVMFAYLGLVPISAGLAALVIKQYSAIVMFEGIGVAMVVSALLFLFNRRMRAFSDDPPVLPTSTKVVG